MLPQRFIEMMGEVLGDQASLLVEALEGEGQSTSIRFNPYKVSQKPEGRSIAWNRYGLYLEKRPQFTLDPHFHAGAYYVQEASSMFVEHLYRSAVGEKEGVRVLDLCAAPGGKATLYSTLVGLSGLVVANEVIRSRALTLCDNTQRWGLGNMVVTNNDPSHFACLREWFDVVAVDAPCSGEGMFRKSEEARLQWSEENVKLCAARQKRIISDVWDSLKHGGVMIYSTCTFNSQEDEDNVRWITENFDCEPVDIDVPEGWGIVKSLVNGVSCFHFYPHKIEGEGFFVAILRKSGQVRKSKSLKPRKTPFTELNKKDITELSRWVLQPEHIQFLGVGLNAYGYYGSKWKDVKFVAEQMNVLYSGVCMGQLFNGKLKPAHSLALFHDVNRDGVHCANIELEDALRYLRKDDLLDLSPLVEGINLICYEGAPIGWSKRIGGRVNNMLPKELRILNL